MQTEFTACHNFPGGAFVNVYDKIPKVNPSIQWEINMSW